MAIKTFKPTSPGRRFQTVTDYSKLDKKPPEKRLTAPLKSHGGRNNRGRITVRFRGGGHKRRYRIVDFKRAKRDVPARVKALEYDPARSAWLALVIYADGEKAYILAPTGLDVGDTVLASEEADIRPGNALPLRRIPLGTQVHNVELKIGKGGQMVRSAGTFAQVMAKEGKHCLLRLPSGELRKVHIECYATVGQVSNLDHENVSYGKAGRVRWLGRRPHNRGTSMNPIDHPHGGGEGKTKGGRNPVTPWGIPTKGYKTRKNLRTDTFIVKRRK